MLKLITISMGLSLLVTPMGFSQSLAEVAKKEKERREDIDEETKTIDDWELSQAKGDGLSVTGSDVSEDEEKSPPDRVKPSSEASSRTTDPQEMRRRRDAYIKRLASAQASLKAAQNAAKTCRQALRRPSEVRVSDGCKGANNRVRSAQESLRRIQSQRP